MFDFYTFIATYPAYNRMEILVDIIKVAIITGIVVLGFYLIMKKYLESKQQAAFAERQILNNKDNTPLKFEAYERLLMLSERLSIPNLIYRLNNSQMTAQQLMQSMMITTQTEFDHNITQQLYVSTPLWKIMVTAKNETLEFLNHAMEKIDPNESSSIAAQQLVAMTTVWKQSPMEVVQKAIHEEVKTILK